METDDYRRIGKGRRTGQAASPVRNNLRPECRNEFSMSELLKVVYEHYGMTDIVLEIDVKNAYRDIVGPLIFRLTEKVVYKKGVLSVKLSSAALKNELSFRKESLIQKINEKVGSVAVTKIQLR